MQLVADDHTKYQAGHSVTTESLDGELVLLCLERGIYYGLDTTGTLIWQGLIKGDTPDIVTKMLATRFPDVDQQTIVADVQRLVFDLVSAGLLQPATP